jgi:predicted lipid-binding transport protein (Tim44 family)
MAPIKRVGHRRWKAAPQDAAVSNTQPCGIWIQLAAHFFKKTRAGLFAPSPPPLRALHYSAFKEVFISISLLFIQHLWATIVPALFLFQPENTMKKILSMLAVVVTIGLSSVPMDADAAKRMGAGKSLGMQRQAATPNKAPTATPNQTPANAAAAAPAAAGTAAAAAAAPKRSWMGPLAGLAAGLGLAALASHFGLGGELASMLMFGLLAAAVMVGVGFFMRKRAAARQQASGNTVGGMQYAGAGAPADVRATPAADSNAAYKTAVPASVVGSAIGSGIGSGLSSPVASPSIPADFDTAGFVRNAKVNFIRLQAANDAGNLEDIRQFTTPEMFAQLKMDLSDRGAAAQQTDVVSIDGNVLEVVEENGHYIVSVRFTGLIREEASAPSESFDEVWHLTKPLQGNGGWVLSGIQQM